MVNPSSYEEVGALNTYLLFHYGSFEEQLGGVLPINQLGADDHSILAKAANYPSLSVNSILDRDSLSPSSTALDVGCSVGKSSFALAEFCKEVLGVDYSDSFISAATSIANGKDISCLRSEEGVRKVSIELNLPPHELRQKVQFKHGNAEELELGMSFDVLHAANLLCRLQDPRKFLSRVPDLLNLNGQLLLSSPYSWLEEYTPKDNWIGGTKTSCSADAVKEYLSERGLTLEVEKQLPFIIREHSRKFQLSYAHAMRFRKTTA